MLRQNLVKAVPLLSAVSLALVFFWNPSSSFGQIPVGRSPASVKLEAETKKVKEKIEKIGKGNKITIVKRDGKEFYGSVLDIGENTVRIDEVDLKVAVEIDYQQIKKVSEGYGSGKTISGKRHSTRRTLVTIGIGVGALIAFLAYMASQLK
jgi:hypothetical protein